MNPTIYFIFLEP